jgi:hypothetical protein
MDAAEVEKKIRELQTVESWLKMNLNFVQMTVKTLEMQKSALESINETARAVTDPKPGGKKPGKGQG